MSYKANCDECGTPIELCLVVPAVPKKGTTRRHVPLDLDFDPATSVVPASHAVSPGRTTCRVITQDRPIEGHEKPALIHFATCPARLGAPRKANA